MSSTHANPLAVKTDAPPNVIWDVMRAWVKKQGKEKQYSPGAVPQNSAEKSRVFKPGCASAAVLGSLEKNKVLWCGKKGVRAQGGRGGGGIVSRAVHQAL